MENNFTSIIKEWLIDELANYKGQEKDVYLSDLAYDITEEININGSVNFSRYKAQEFIKENFEIFGDLVEYCKDNFEMALNPFSEPEKAEVIAYIEGVRYLLDQLDSLREADQQSEYQQITLTDQLLDQAIEELKAKEFEIEF